MIAEGHLSVHDPVISFFPDAAPEEPTWQLEAMRVSDLLTMSTGHIGEDLRAFSFDSTEPLPEVFLHLPVAHKPGTHFNYNTPASYMLSAIVHKLTGENLLDYLRPRLLDPLGIADATWSADAQGVAHGGLRSEHHDGVDRPLRAALFATGHVGRRATAARRVG